MTDNADNNAVTAGYRSTYSSPELLPSVDSELCSVTMAVNYVQHLIFPNSIQYYTC